MILARPGDFDLEATSKSPDYFRGGGRRGEMRARAHCCAIALSYGIYKRNQRVGGGFIFSRGASPRSAAPKHR
jgi:hypothetical protein